MVQAAALDGVVEVAGAVGGEDDDRRVRRGDRAELGDRHARLREQLEQERLEVVVGAVDLVDQQHRRPRAGMLERAQERPPDQVVGAEQVLLAQRRAARVGEPDAEQLARVVPLVERLGGVDPLVALQAHERRVEHRRERLRGLRLADAGLALEQQRLRQAHAEEDRRREPLVDEVVDRGEPPRERLDVGDERAHLVGRSPVTRGRVIGGQGGEHGLVVLRGVHVARDRARDRHLGDIVAAPVEQAPDALVAVQVGELAERRCGRTRSGAAPVVVAADRERRVAAAGEQRVTGRR